MDNSKFEIGDLVLLPNMPSGNPLALLQITSKSIFHEEYSYKAKLIISLEPRKIPRDNDVTNHVSDLWFLEHEAVEYSLEETQEFAAYLNKSLLLVNFK